MYENQGIGIKIILIRSFFIVALLLTCALIKNALIGNYITLSKAPPLAAEVSLSIGSSNKNNLPTPNKDFLIVASKYFDNNDWAVVALKSPNTDTASVVLEKINGVYAVVLGPGTEFPSDVVQEMPISVSTYLINQGLIH